MNVVVIKLNGGKATVLTDNGDFLNIPQKSGMKAGASFEYTPQKLPKRAAWSVAAAVLLFLLGFGISGTFMASSYIDVNINPGVRLAVNQWGKVISAQAINEDGQILINEIGGSFLQDPQSYVKQIIQSSWEEGKLKASGQIILTISDDDLQRAQVTEKTILEAAIQTVKEMGLSINIRLQKLDRGAFEILCEKQEALDDESKSQVYITGDWYSKKGEYIEETEYAGNGLIEVEFSGNAVLTAKEAVLIEDLYGVSYSVQIITWDGEKLLIQCSALKEDNIYKVTIFNFGAEEKTLTSFLYIGALENENDLNGPYDESSGDDGREAESEYESDHGSDYESGDEESGDNEAENEEDEDSDEDFESSAKDTSRDVQTEDSDTENERDSHDSEDDGDDEEEHSHD